MRTHGLLAAAVAAAALAVAPATAPAGQIVWVKDQALWAMNDDGTNQHPLATREQFAAVVPDYRWLEGLDVSEDGRTLVLSIAIQRGYTADICYPREGDLPEKPSMGLHCVGLFLMRDGKVTRLSPEPSKDPDERRYSGDYEPQFGANGVVVHRYDYTQYTCRLGTPYCLWDVFTRDGWLQARPLSGGTPLMFNYDEVGAFAADPIVPRIAWATGVLNATCNAALETTAGCIMLDGDVIGFDDNQPKSMAFAPDGSLIADVESGTGPGLWTFPPAPGPGDFTHILEDQNDSRWFDDVEFAGTDRLILTVWDSPGSKLYSVPLSCRSSACTFPASTTLLAGDGDNTDPAWTPASAPITPLPPAPVKPDPKVTPTPTPAPTPTPTPGPDDDGGVLGKKDTSAPRISALAIAPSAFRAAKGARISFRLSEPARVRFSVERKAGGRRKGGRCVAPTPRNRRGRRCTRYVATSTAFAHPGTQGANRLRFSGRPLTPGRFRLAAAATDAAGNRSASVYRPFRILR